MKIQRIKGLTWLSALAIGGLLAVEVVDYLRNQALLEQYVPQERLKEVLNDVEQPEPPRDDVVDYRFVKNVFMDMNWTGKAPPPPPPPGPPDGDREPPKTPVSDLLHVLVLQVDTVDPKGSLAYVQYTAPKLQKHNEKHEDRILRVGAALHPPFGHIEVDAITMEEVRFVFTGKGEREPETVRLTEGAGDYPGIVVVDDAIMPSRERSIFTRPDAIPYNPKQTTEIRRNEFQIGTDTLTELDRDYSRILSQDLRYRTYRNPKTGNVEGIQITDVRAGSLPARHGVTKGEVLISINGHPVKGVNDAVAYVKANADTTDTWVAVFLKQGREITRTYRSPKD